MLYIDIKSGTGTFLDSKSIEQQRWIGVSSLDSKGGAGPIVGNESVFGVQKCYWDLVLHKHAPMHVTPSMC